MSFLFIREALYLPRYLCSTVFRLQFGQVRVLYHLFIILIFSFSHEAASEE